MICTEYIWIYQGYSLFMILGGLIWLWKKRWEVHHWQVGIVVLISAIPLALFVFTNDDSLGYHLLVDVLILGTVAVFMDFKDMMITLGAEFPNEKNN